MQLIGFLAQHQTFLFIIAIAAMLGRMAAASSGNLRLMRQLSWPMFIASLALGIVNAAVCALTFRDTGNINVVALLMTALWGWNAHSSYLDIRRR